MFDACLQRTIPLLEVLNIAQKDDTTWLELIEAFEAQIPRFDDVGLSEVSSILEKRSKMLQNEVVLLMKYLKNPSFVIDFDLIKGWLSLLKVDDEFKNIMLQANFLQTPQHSLSDSAPLKTQF